MRKLFINFVLLAAGLLVGTNAWAEKISVYESGGFSALSEENIPDNAVAYVKYNIGNGYDYAFFDALDDAFWKYNGVEASKISGLYILDDGVSTTELTIPSDKVSNVCIEDTEVNKMTINSDANNYYVYATSSGLKIGTSLDNYGKLYYYPPSSSDYPTITISNGAVLTNKAGGWIEKNSITDEGADGTGTIINEVGGTISTNNKVNISVSSWTNSGKVTSAGVPNGSVFCLPTTNTGIVEITGAGLYNADPTEYLKPAATAVLSVEKQGDKWNVTKTSNSNIVKIGETGYTSFANAYKKANDGDVLTLFANVAIAADLSLDKNITVDKQSGYTLTVQDGKTLTINSDKTLTIIGDGATGIIAQGSLAVNGTIQRESMAGTSGNEASTVKLNGLNATLTVNGGSIIGNASYHGAPVYIVKAKEVSLTNNAVISNTKPDNQTGIGSYGLYIAAMPATMTVNGVTITSYDNAIRNAVSTACTLTSGKFNTLGSSAVLSGNIIAAKGTQFNKVISSAFFDPEQYICEEVSTGLWEIVDKPVAPIAVDFLQIGEDKYNSFEDMVEALQDNDVINVIADAKIPALTAVTIEKNNVTLNMNGHKLTVDDQMIGSISDYTDGGMYAFNITGSLTVNGNANSLISVPGGMFQVAEGGELTINGGEYKTLIIPVPTKIVKNSGTLAINAATMNAAAGCIENYGVANIDGGTYTSLSTSKAPAGYSGIDYYTLYYCYGIINNASMNISNATVKGVQGALGCETEGARLTVRNCDVSAQGSEDYSKNDSHAALYVCTYAIADVYNSSFKSERENYSVYVGNNDMTTKWGVVNLYAGTKLAHKAYVQTAITADATFNPIVPKNSTWYTAWEEGSNIAPLPDGYTYASINEDGYAWVVNGPAGKQSEEVVSSETTIPWKETSTWSSNVVPTETTIATIPDKKQVVIGDGETANAYQVFIGGDNAKLTVEEDAFLTVGEGGMNIADGGQMVIEPGAVVKVGAAGVINSSDDAIVIKAEKNKAGAFLIGPAVNEATHPYATVEMYTKARAYSDVEHRWQHFAIPTNGKPSVTPLPHDHKEDAKAIYMYQWNYTSKEWETLGTWDKLNIPFQGYNLTNNLPDDTYDKEGGVTYVFHGNIIGNGNGDLKFLSKGYNFFGNSYTAPIDIATMFESLDANIEKTIAIYDVDKNQYVYSNEMMIKLGFETTSQINPLQGFFLNLKSGSKLDEQINYEKAVYDNPRLTAGHGGLAAPARQTEINANTVAIHVEANGNADCITLVEMNDLSNDFENGFDATKLMNESNLNLYANTLAGQLGIVATNDLVGTAMDFQSNEAKQYTMTFSNVNGEVYELLDVLTGVRTRMEEGATYTFNAEANKTVANRFQVCAARGIYTNNEQVEGDAAIQGIYTVLGQPMGNDWEALPAGVYVINGERVVK